MLEERDGWHRFLRVCMRCWYTEFDRKVLTESWKSLYRKCVLATMRRIKQDCMCGFPSTVHRSERRAIPSTGHAWSEKEIHFNTSGYLWYSSGHSLLNIFTTVKCKGMEFPSPYTNHKVATSTRLSSSTSNNIFNSFTLLLVKWLNGIYIDDKVLATHQPSTTYTTSTHVKQHPQHTKTKFIHIATVMTALCNW